MNTFPANTGDNTSITTGIGDTIFDSQAEGRGFEARRSLHESPINQGRRSGPAWTERGRPAAGYFTKRTAEDWLRGLLDEARRGTLPGAVRTGATFADAAAEWLRYVEHDRAAKPSTMVDYRSSVKQLLAEFGQLRVEDVTARRIEQWRANLGQAVRGRSATAPATSC